MTVRGAGAVAAAVVVALMAASPASALAPRVVTVNAQYSAFGPTPVDLLPGDSVLWTNVSDRFHTVTADDASFDSGQFAPAAKFSRTFDSPGTFAYHCTIHAGMVGVVDVRPVILDPLPPAAVPAGDAVELSGRSSDPSQRVRIEAAGDGASFHEVGGAVPGPDGTWSTTVAAGETADYRAAIDAGTSSTRRLLVSNRRVGIRATRRGLAVTVTPALPYGRVMLQLDLRGRFGWWPARRAKLDYVSRVGFRVRRPARARVVLLDEDGWTALATSKVITLGHFDRARPEPGYRRPRHMRAGH